MFNYLLVIALAVLVGAEPMRLRPPYPNGRIVGGEDALIETYPYQAALEWYGHICGASIISEYHVVTAGHCIVAAVTSMNIRVGTSYRSRDGRVHQLAEVIRHENYSSNLADVPLNDIAIVKVAEPFVFDDTTQPINLYESGEEATPGVKAVVTGWGATRQGGFSTYQLRSVSIPIVDKKLCNDAYLESHGGIPDGQICAAYYGEGGKDACQGDSGGPLAIDGRLAGVVSWGNGCAQAYFPGAYTEIAHYREWINKHVQLA